MTESPVHMRPIVNRTLLSIVLGTAALALACEPPAAVVHGAPKALAPGASTHDWGGFLGPTHNAVATEANIDLDWPTGGPRQLWEVETGAGYASPAIADGRLVFFHRVGEEERIECVDPETGTRQWTHSYPSHYRDRYDFSDGPRASPVISGGRVFTHGAEGKLHCLDLATGKVVWQRDISAEYSVPQDFFGVGSSPLVHGDLLVVQVGAPKGPTVVALEVATGKEKWRAGGEWTAGYASPIPARMHGRDFLFVFAGGDSDPPSGGLLVIDLESGTLTDRFAFRSKTYTSVNASSPVIDGDRVFISSSYRTGGVQLRIDEDGKLSETWRTKDFGAHFMTPIIRDGHLFGVTGGGKGNTELVCLDWNTGKTLWRHVPEWQETVTRNGQTETIRQSSFLGSLLLIDASKAGNAVGSDQNRERKRPAIDDPGAQWLLLGELGHLAVLDLTPDGYREIRRTRLFTADQTWCAPVLSRGLLYICQNRPDRSGGSKPRLLCYDLRGG